jgi:hypothetical protein
VADAAIGAIGVIGAIGAMYVHENFLRKLVVRVRVTPQSLLASALWGYLKCMLSERNNSLDCCDVCVGRPGAGAMNLRPYKADALRVRWAGEPYGCGRNEFAPLQG